jgi:hypothetical protein
VLGAVLLGEQLGVEAEVLGVGAQERLDQRPVRKDPELVVLERAQVLGADLRVGLGVGDVELTPQPGLAEPLADRHGPYSIGRARVPARAGRVLRKS